ncbi:MAG: dienelactone hydrolase family protein [Acidobacteria bacterium]|nr:dienelactone hydrolase family protein [Acidobacteriota bacterium]
MRRTLAVLLAGTLLGGTASAQQAPSAEDAAARLADSPRHGEWVVVDTPGGPVSSWVVYPERADGAPVIVVIHEIFGLTDWIRSVADGFAAEGFIAIAPDLLSGKGPDGGGTDSLESPRTAIRDLDPAEVKVRLDGVAHYGMSLPAATDRFGVVGFCWGGSTSFRYATLQPGAGAAVVYYGGSPPSEDLANLQVPVLGLYGGNDNRVNATIAPAQEALSDTDARYEVEIYDGAGHGFLRAQNHDELGQQNTAAATAGWPRTIAFFRELLER